MFARHESTLSSQVEGTHSTLEDVLEFEVSGEGHRKPKDAQEIVNYVRAMNYVNDAGIGESEEVFASTRQDANVDSMVEKPLKAGMLIEITGAREDAARVTGARPHGSALAPCSSLGWPSESPEFARVLPSSGLITGFDSLFFWVARMAMMSLHLT